MSVNWRDLNKDLQSSVIQFCRGIAGSCDISALCIVGDYAVGLQDSEVLQVMVVLKNFQPRLLNRVTSIDGRNTTILAVDKWVFERDVCGGFLGEALAQKMIFPYLPLVNKDYLHIQEVKLKKRLIIELLENLVLDFPELSYHLHIKPEYFMYQILLNRVRLFPPLRDTVSTLMQGNLKNRHIQQVMEGYLEALKELENKEVVIFSDGFLTATEEFVKQVEQKKVRLLNIFKTTHRTFFNSMFETFSKTLELLSENNGDQFNLQKWSDNSKVPHRLDDPLRYLFLPTGEGLVPLSSKMDIEDFAKQVVSADDEIKIDVEEIGGVLNDVYLVKVGVKGRDQKIIAKRFKAWSSLKWFPLNLWTVGTANFAVLPRSRLERECVINQMLYSEGFNVPKILHVSHSKRLLFREYIEGERLTELLTTVLRGNTDETLVDLSSIIRNIGGIFAEAHSLGIALGDTKPENILIREKNGQVYLLDMEQASRTGDHVWDIAEFLYYTGHYIPPLAGSHPAKLIAQAFIQGYLHAGGDVNLVKKASTFQYTKVFTPFTLPHLILVISNTCKNSDKLKIRPEPVKTPKERVKNPPNVELEDE